MRCSAGKIAAHWACGYLNLFLHLVLLWPGNGLRPLMAEPLTELPPLEVEATRVRQPVGEVPYALSVVGQEEIQTAQLQLTLAETLDAVPGVFVLNPWNFAQDTRIAIRGFGARADFGIRGIQLLVDGIPATTPDGQGEVDSLDLGSAARIEILRGPGSAFYGPSSGGVIRIRTEDPPETPFAETRWTSGEDGFQHLQFKAGGEAGPGGVLLSGGRFRSDGAREHSETDQRRLNGKAEWILSDTDTLRLSFNLLDYPLQNDPGGLTRAEAEENPRQARDRNVQFDAGEEVTQQRLGLFYESAPAPDLRLEAAVYGIQRDFQNRLPFESGGQVTLDRQVTGARFQARQKTGSGSWAGGVDIGHQQDDRENYDNLTGIRGPLALDQQETVVNLGLFGFVEQELAEDWAVSAALRHDVVRFEVDDRFLADGDDSGDLDFRETTPSVAVRWSPRPGWSVFGNLSQSFETPTTTELDNPDGGGFNPDLDVQTARGIEIGSRGQVQKDTRSLRWDFAVFYLEVEDALVPYELEEFPGREFYRNSGTGTRQGFESALRFRFAERFGVGLEYTWSDFEYSTYQTGGEDFSGNQIPGIPEHTGGIRLSYEDPAGLFAESSTRVVGRFQADDANTETIEATTVTDMRMGARWTRGAWEFEPYLGIRNLFNQRAYANIRINAFGGRYFEPAPDRSLYGGLRLRRIF